ncbi:MAG: 4Fe-4S binding protein [Candidatus Hydrogenedentes bacterium]|nr:4Fe-4S binding protein [Candidatus Hydrogenedentota bacterium]
MKNNVSPNPVNETVSLSGSLSAADLKQCLCADHEKDLDQALRDKLALLRHEDVQRPTIYIGMGTCGLGAGAGKTLTALRAWLETNKQEADIVEVGCIGLCSVEPIVDVQLPGRRRVSFEKVTEKMAGKLLESVFNGKTDAAPVLGQYAGEGLEAWDNTPALEEHPFFAPQTRLVLALCGEIDPCSLDEYAAHGGYRSLNRVLTDQDPAGVCDAVEQSGLRGRGGGGFPTGRKWKFARGAEGDQKYLICNADEGDPGAFMDRAIIEGAPHRLIEGMIIAGYAIGASKGYVYIRAEYPLAISRLKTALKQAHDAGLLGDNILGSDFNFDIVLKMGAGAFVCGEETALIHSVEGKRGMPRPRPPFPAVRGAFGKPTIINNVETLANIPPLLAMGAEAFAAMGTDDSKGTKVFALSGKVTHTGLVEVAMGTSIRDIIFTIGGGVPNERRFKAVQMGGPSGGCIPEAHLDIEVDYNSLKSVGAIMGSGGMVVMDEDTCMVDVAKFFMDFVQRESCGKCIPCREGTRRILEILQRITRGERNESTEDALQRFQGIVYMERLAKVIQDTSLCGLGQTAPNPVLSTLRWFRDEYEAHIYERHCPAGVCQELRYFVIDQDKCTGCTLCAKRCPTDAIVGELKQAHYILADKCIGCGACVNVCRFDAVELRQFEDALTAAP